MAGGSGQEMQMQQLPGPYRAYLLQPLLLSALETLRKAANPPVSTVYLYSIISEKDRLQERKHRNLPRISCGVNTR